MSAFSKDISNIFDKDFITETDIKRDEKDNGIYIDDIKIGMVMEKDGVNLLIRIVLFDVISNKIVLSLSYKYDNDMFVFNLMRIKSFYENMEPMLDVKLFNYLNYIVYRLEQILNNMSNRELFTTYMEKFLKLRTDSVIPYRDRYYIFKSLAMLDNNFIVILQDREDENNIIKVDFNKIMKEL